MEVEMEVELHPAASPEARDVETTNEQVFNDTAEKNRASPTPSSTYSNDDALLHPNSMYTQSESGVLDANSPDDLGFLDGVMEDVEAWVGMTGEENAVNKEYAEGYEDIVVGVARGVVGWGLRGGGGVCRRFGFDGLSTKNVKTGYNSVDEYSVFCVRRKRIYIYQRTRICSISTTSRSTYKTQRNISPIQLTPQPHPHPHSHQHSAANTSTDLSPVHQPATRNPPYLDAYSTASSPNHRLALSLKSYPVDARPCSAFAWDPWCKQRHSRPWCRDD
jgi:hypothetical protein